jgi:hypothetical protein
MAFQLYDLIANKAFNELNENEQSFVLSQISEEAYFTQRKLHLLFLEVELEEEELIPKDAILTTALVALKPSTPIKKTNRFTPLFLAKVPAWSAIAACFLLYLFVKNSQVYDGQKSTFVASAEKIDTVYIQYVPTEKKQARERKQLITTNLVQQTNPKHTLPLVEPILMEREDRLISNQLDFSTIITHPKPSKGVSVKNDPLSKLITISIN